MSQCQRSGQMAERPFRLILGALLLGFAAIRIIYQRRASRGAEPVIRPERDQNMVAHASMLVIGCAMAIGYLRDARWMRRFTMPLPAWIRWIGACLALAALLLLRWAHEVLGTNFSSRLHTSPEEGLHIPLRVVTVLCSGKEPCLLFDSALVSASLVRR